MEIEAWKIWCWWFCCDSGWVSMSVASGFEAWEKMVVNQKDLGKTIQIEEGRIMCCVCVLCFKWMTQPPIFGLISWNPLWGTHISQKQGWFHHKGISKEIWAPCLCTWCQIPNQQQVQVWSATGTSWQCTYDMTSWFLCRNWSSFCRQDVRVIRAPYANLVSCRRIWL